MDFPVRVRLQRTDPIRPRMGARQRMNRIERVKKLKSEIIEGVPDSFCQRGMRAVHLQDQQFRNGNGNQLYAFALAYVLELKDRPFGRLPPAITYPDYDEMAEKGKR